MFDSVYIGRTFVVGASNGVYARQSGVQLRVPVNDMVELLTALSQLCTQNTDPLFRNRVVHRSAITAIIDDVIRIVIGDFNIKHITTVDTELHVFVDWNGIYIRFYYLCLLFRE